MWIWLVTVSGPTFPRLLPLAVRRVYLDKPGAIKKISVKKIGVSSRRVQGYIDFIQWSRKAHDAGLLPIDIHLELVQLILDSAAEIPMVVILVLLNPVTRR